MIAILFGTLLFVGIEQPGPAMWPDSAGYLSVARSLTEGKGIMRYDGREQFEQPPLYPAVLAAMSVMLALEPLACVGLLNAILYSLFVWCMGRLILRLFEPANTGAFLLLTLVLVVAHPVVAVMLYLGSEALFMVLLLSFLISASKYIDRPSRTDLVLMLLAGALAALTRYAGVALAVAGGVVVVCALRDRSVFRRLAAGIGFILVSVLPLGLFILRNYLLHNTFTGTRSGSVFTLTQNLRSMMDTLFSWSLPVGLAGSRPVFILLGMGIAIALFYPMFEKVHGHSGAGPVAQMMKMKFRPVFIFGLVYAGFILLAATLSNMDGLGSRLLVPLFIPFGIFAIGLMLSVVDVLSRLMRRPLANAFATGIVLAVLIPQIAASSELLQRFFERQMTYLSPSWKNSETLTALRKNWRGEEVFSNQPEAVYVVTGIHARPIPSKTLYNSNTPAISVESLRGVWPPDDTALVVWFSTYLKNRGFYTPDEISHFTRLLSSHELSDGRLMKVKVAGE